jgi:hypothetical protein
MAAKFDILYAPAALVGDRLRVYTMAREVEAIDRPHALLWWLRHELGLTVDLVEMSEEPFDYTASCDCDFFFIFGVDEQPKRLLRRMPEPALGVHIESTPCEVHEEKSVLDPPQKHRHWNGEFVAWPHDPKREDEYYAARI